MRGSRGSSPGRMPSPPSTIGSAIRSRAEPLGGRRGPAGRRPRTARSASGARPRAPAATGGSSSAGTARPARRPPPGGPARSRRRRTGPPRARGSSSGRSGRAPAPGRPSPARDAAGGSSAPSGTRTRSRSPRGARAPPSRRPTCWANSASSPSNDSKVTRGSSPTAARSMRQPLAHREERLLRRVHRHGDDHPVGQRQAPADQVLVALRRRIERARVDRDAGHGAWQKVRAVSPYRRVSSPSSRSLGAVLDGKNARERGPAEERHQPGGVVPGVRRIGQGDVERRRPASRSAKRSASPR